MLRWIITLLILLGLLAPLRAAPPVRCAVWIEGGATRQLEEGLLFRLRHATPRPRLVESLRAASRASAFALARTKGCDRLIILNAANGQGSIHDLQQVSAPALAEIRGEGKAGPAAIERLALAFEGRRAPAIQLDIVCIIDCGGAMHRLVKDAAETISQLGVSLQNGLPVPDVRWGLMTFSSSDTLTWQDLGPSSERIAQVVRERRSGYGDGILPLDAIIQLLLHSITWRAGSSRYAILYTNSAIATRYQQLGQLAGPGIRLITIPADGATSETHRILKILAERSRGISLIPEYLVRYRDQANLDRACILKERTLLRLSHDIPEPNWKRHYRGVREPAGGSRRFRAGTIDESIAILGRSGHPGIRIREVQSSLGDSIITALNRLQPASARIKTAHPDALCRILFGKEQILFPIVRYGSIRVNPQTGAWLGLSIIPDRYAEGQFRVHPQSLLLLPTQYVPPLFLQRGWSTILRNPGRALKNTLFTPGRVFLRVRNLSLIPLAKRPYLLEP